MPSELVQVISLLYSMQSDDIDTLESELLMRRKIVWRNTIEAQARLHGCPNAVANDPARNDLAELKAMCDEDARSIAHTWNTQLENEITRLFTANPRGNRTYYYSNIAQWNFRRNQYKAGQIALYTDSSTRAYTENRFRVENGLRGQKYVYQAQPPHVSEECIKRFAAGVVDEAYVQRHPVPAHVNCPHNWVVINADQVGCTDIWVG